MDSKGFLQGRWWIIVVALLFLALIAETAHFGWKALNVEGPPTNMLSLTVSGSGSVDPGVGTHALEKDKLVIVAAEPDEGWVFSHWVGPVTDPKSPRTTLTLDSDIELEAVFVEEDPGYFAFTLETRGRGEVFPDPGKHEFLSTEEGSLIAVKATPAPGYVFDRWTVNGLAVSSDPVYQFALTNGAVLTAHFEPLYTVTVDSTKGGIARGPEGPLEKGEAVKVEAISRPGYGFKEWIEDEKVVSENPVHFFKVAGNHHLTARFLPLYTVKASATEGGVVEPAYQTALEGETVRVTAKAHEGYAFIRWLEEGRPVADGIDLGFAFIPLHYIRTPDYRFTLNRDRTLVAEFAKVYNIDVTVANNIGGSVKTPGTTTLAGRKSMIIAVPDEGYLFEKWTEGDKEYYDPVFEFRGDRHLQLTAHFVPACNISTAVEPENGGRVRGGGAYKPGEEIVLKAYPAEYHRFSGWYENGTLVSDQAQLTFNAAEDRHLVARFEPYTEITLTATPAEGGRVIGAGFYEKGSQVTITAIANPGYEFDYWLRDGVRLEDAGARYRFTAEADFSFEAVFRKVNEYTVTLASSLPEGGYVSGGGTFNEGSTVSVFAIPKVNYRFVNWTEDGEVVSNDISYSFTLTEDRSLVANFVKVFYLGLTAEPKEGGSFEGRGYYGDGSSVSVEAKPSYGYRFSHWTEDGEMLSYGSSFTFNIDRNRSLVGHFVKAHQVQISFGEFVGGTVHGAGLYDVGQTVTVTAEPFSNFVFVHWTQNGEVVSTQPVYEFIMPDEPVELVAHFLPLYDINVVASPVEGGSVSGGGVYVRGDRVTVEAVANPGYDFYCWVENGTTVSYSATYVFYAEKSCTLTAIFRPLRQVTLEGTPPEGTLELNATWKYPAEKLHPEGAEITISATPAQGYSFLKWTVGSAEGETLLDDQGNPAGRVHTFTVSGDLHLVAHFEEIPRYVITVEASPPEWGTVSGGDIYQEGTTATVIATPNPGYYFSRWTENGSQVSTSANYSFTVTRDRHLVAEFVEPVTVRAYSNNSSRGQVSIQHPGGTTAQGPDVTVSVAPGSSVTLRAHATSGNAFDGWYEGSSRVSTSVNYSVTISSNRTFEARFSESKGTSCPFVYSFNETGYHLENEAISQFRSKALENTFYGTLHNLREVDGKYHVQIAEKMPEKSFINWFKLLAVDYPADSGISGVVADIYGNPHTIKDRVAPVAFTDDQGRNWLDAVVTEGVLVRSDYRDFRQGKPVVSYEAEFVPTDEMPLEAKLLIRLKADAVPSICWDWFMDTVDGVNNQWWIDEILNREPFKEKFISFTDIVALRVELWNGTEWVLQGLVRPGDLLQEYLIPIDLSDLAGDAETVKIRLTSGSGFFIFDQVSMDFSENEILALTELQPESAVFNESEDVIEVLTDDNDERVRLLIEDRIDLVYTAPELPDNRARGFMAFLHGYYHAAPDVKENPTANYWGELSNAEIMSEVILTIPGAVKVLPELVKMYQLMESVAELPFEEKVSKIIIEHVLPWMEEKGIE